MREGQILVEVMIAISITVISLIGFFGLLKSSFQLTRLASENYIATHLAVEGVEIVANKVQENYIESVTSGTSFNKNITQGRHEIDYQSTVINSTNEITQPRALKFDGAFYQYTRGEDTKLYRVVDIGLGTNVINVTSTVYGSASLNTPIAQVSDTFEYWWRQ